MVEQKGVVRVAAAGDLHCGRDSEGVLQPLFASLAGEADVLALCGDLTDYGHPEEAHLLARELATVKVPIVAVLGNHDYESGQGEQVKEILCEAGIRVLDGDAVELEGIGFAGVKGFAGGFGERMLGGWGEQAIKLFVREAVDEALKLESALARLRMPGRIALLHYSPIQATVEGEPREIFPFLGSSRLEEPLNRVPLTAVLHGHAHHGSPAGQLPSGTPVYNVAMPLLRRLHADRPPFRIIEIGPDGRERRDEHRSGRERRDASHPDRERRSAGQPLRSVEAP